MSSLENKPTYLVTGHYQNNNELIRQGDHSTVQTKLGYLRVSTHRTKSQNKLFLFSSR